MCVEFLGVSYECSTAIKGPDYVHLLDANGLLIASFHGVADFSAFTLSEGEWTNITDYDGFNIAVVAPDGTVKKSSKTFEDVLQGVDAATVNGHTVEKDVPADAQFTDTVYTHPTYDAKTGVPTANQTPAFGGTFSVTQPVSDGTGHVTGMNTRNVTIPATPASASAAGLVNTGAQTFAGNKTFNGQIIPNGASDLGVAQARKIYAGTADIEAGVTALTTGAIYLVYE